MLKGGLHSVKRPPGKPAGKREGTHHYLHQRRRNVQAVGDDDGAAVLVGLRIENAEPIYLEDRQLAWQLQDNVLVVVGP